MNDRAKRIKRLVEESGKTYNELEKITGIAKSSLQRYASGATAKIPLAAVEKLAAAFGVSQAHIMGWDEKPAEDLQAMGALAAQVVTDPDAMEMARQYMAMDQADRQAVRDFMALGDADRYAVRLVMASMAQKQKKTDAGASVTDVEEILDKA